MSVLKVHTNEKRFLLLLCASDKLYSAMMISLILSGSLLSYGIGDLYCWYFSVSKIILTITVYSAYSEIQFSKFLLLKFHIKLLYQMCVHVLIKSVIIYCHSGVSNNCCRVSVTL